MRILLGVSGGIAAYKALELIRLATGAGHSVRVVGSAASREFVGAASFAALSGGPVLYGEFERDPMRGVFPDQPLPSHEPISHLALVENADVLVVAPASANTIAKLAVGLSDNLLAACALAAECPLVIAPAMNNRMYGHPATQANLAALRERGARIVEPGVGRLASKGEHGVGRLAEPAEILEVCERAGAGKRPVTAPSAGERLTVLGGESPAPVERLTAPSGDGPLPNGAAALHSRSLAGLHVLVTAGGTREPIDSVRYIGNSSSGRMGFALASVARARGAEVALIAANVALDTPEGVRRVDVRTAAELKAVAEREFEDCEVLLMAAAVADFAPAPEQGKIKKDGRRTLELVLEATPDVISGLAARRRPGQTIVAFAAEHGADGVRSAREKLTAKRVDAVVFNDISQQGIGFDSGENEVTIITAAAEDGAPAERHVDRAPKELVAGAILDAVVTLRGGLPAQRS